MRTHYDLLGVCPDADDEALRKAYHKAAKAHHPDLNGGDPDAPRRFSQIATAIEILRNPQQRAAYDRSLERERQRRRLRRARIAIVIANTIAAAVLIGVLTRGQAPVGPNFSTLKTQRMVIRVEDRAERGPVAEEAELRTQRTEPTGGDEPSHSVERSVTVPDVSVPLAEAEPEAHVVREQNERRQAAEHERQIAEREATLGHEQEERRPTAGRERQKAGRQAAPRREQNERRPDRKPRASADVAEIERAAAPTPAQPVQGARTTSSGASARSLGPVEIAAARAFARF